LSDTELQREDLGSSRALVLAVIVIALAVVGLLCPLPLQGRLSTALGDLMHAPLFAALTLSVLGWLEVARPQRLGPVWLRRCAGVCLGWLVFGIAMELFQQRLGRSAALHDVMANGLGIAGAALCHVGWRWKRERPAESWLPRSMWLTAGAMLALAWWQPLSMLRDVVAVQADFPLLASFESPMELGRFYYRDCAGSLSRQDATHRSQSLQIAYQPTAHPGATLIEMCPDWSAMRTLEMDVTLDRSAPAGGATLLVKVIDFEQLDEHDIYVGTWQLQPGVTQHLCIPRADLVVGPRTRSLNLSRIRWLDLVVVEPAQTTLVRVDAMKLTLAP
jgi:hypothetical protein